MNEQQRMAAELDQIAASRRARVERFEAAQLPDEPTPVQEPGTPLVRLDILPSGKPELVHPETMDRTDAILLGMQGLGRLVLDLMEEQTGPPTDGERDASNGA